MTPGPPIVRRGLLLRRQKVYLGVHWHATHAAVPSSDEFPNVSPLPPPPARCRPPFRQLRGLEALKMAYQRPDDETMLRVVTHEAELREVR